MGIEFLKTGFTNPATTHAIARFAGESGGLVVKNGSTALDGDRQKSTLSGEK